MNKCPHCQNTTDQVKVGFAGVGRQMYECKRLEVHHIVPLSTVGSPWPKNCKTLCRKCHIRLYEQPGSLKQARREWQKYSDGI